MRKLGLLVLLASILLCAVPASAQPQKGRHIAEGCNFIVAVQADGTVKAVGDNTYGQCDTSKWRDVVAVAAGYGHTLGLKNDGTVYATGDNQDGQCSVQDWKDIVMVGAGIESSYGLKRDGTIVRTYIRPSQETTEIVHWKNIVWIDASMWYSTCAIDENGRPHAVVADLSQAPDAVQVYDYGEALFVLGKDGSVHFIESDEHDLSTYDDVPVFQELDHGLWSDVVELNWNRQNLEGLRRDGTVARGYKYSSWIKDWTDIVEIESGFGVKSDGSVIYEEDWADDYTPEQLQALRTWKVMVGPAATPGARDADIP